VRQAQSWSKAGKIAFWSPPPSGWIKLNTDAAYCPKTRAASTGVIARGEDGAVLLTAWRFLHRCGSPEEAEAETCLQGIRLVAEWIRLPTQADSECLWLVQALRAGQDGRSRWEGVIVDIVSASKLLPECTFNHVGRTGNQAAHSLAQRGLRKHECVVMRHNMTVEVSSIVQAEAAGDAGCPEFCSSVLL
jgi:hypothetical protein